MCSKIFTILFFRHDIPTKLFPSVKSMWHAKNLCQISTKILFWNKKMQMAPRFNCRMIVSVYLCIATNCHLYFDLCHGLTLIEAHYVLCSGVRHACVCCRSSVKLLNTWVLRWISELLIAQSTSVCVIGSASVVSQLQVYTVFFILYFFTTQCQWRHYVFGLSVCCVVSFYIVGRGRAYF